MDLYGHDYPTEDGFAVRDYVHVCDLARAHRLALEALWGGHSGGAYNIGTGHGFSVQQVVQAVEAECGMHIPVRVAGRRPGDPARLVADSTRLRKEFDFEPLYSDLPTMIRHAWRWQADRLPRLRPSTEDGGQ